jgi:hypothetical protein
VKKGAGTMLSRHNFRRAYHGALAKLANPATAGLRPTAAPPPGPPSTAP